MSAANYHKKLAPFFKEKEKLASKFKAVGSFLDEVTDVKEQQKFFVEQRDPLFAVINEWINTTLEDFKKGKKLKELIICYSILTRICEEQVASIQSKWQYDNIVSLIHRGLYRQNHPQVRSAALELLMRFMDAHHAALEPNLLDEFGSAINLEVFNTNNDKSTFKYSAKGDSASGVFFPATITEPASMNDSLNLLRDVLLKYISERTNNFQFWYDKFKERYLTQFYPKIFQELRIVDKYDETGFRNGCPPEIQCLILGSLMIWGAKPANLAILWEPEVNSHIMLEVHRCSCLLPLDYTPNIKAAMQSWRNWIMKSRDSKVLGTTEVIQLYWQHFIKNLALIFTLESTPTQINLHHKLCMEVLMIYNYFSMELAEKLSPDTWETLQYTTMKAAFDLLNKTETSSQANLINIVSERRTSKAGLNNLYSSQTFGDILFNTLYLIWLKRQNNTEEMWQDLSKKVSALVNWKCNVQQWKEKMIQLTIILRRHLYEKYNKDGEKSENTPDSPSEPRGRGYTREISTGVESVIQSIPIDPRLSSLNWTAESILHTWTIFLNILGNINTINDPTSYEVAWSCIYEIINMLTEAQSKLPLNTPQILPLFSIFLPWLIEGCVYNERLVKGLLLAYRTLCTMFIRNHRLFSSMKNGHHYISHFYRIVQTGLNNVKSEVIWEIIEYSTKLFLCNLQGVAVLIPDYLREIEVLCGPMTTTSSIVKQNGLRIVNSLICYPNHYSLIEFPVIATPKPYETNKIVSVTTDEVKEKMCKILINILNNSNEYADVLMIALCGASVLLFEEMNNPNPRPQFILKFIKSMIEQTEHPNPHVSRIASESLGSISFLLPQLNAIDKNFISTAVLSITERIVNTVKRPSQEHQVIQLLYCLRDFLLGGTNDILSHSNVAEKVFTCIEYSLLGELVSPSEFSPSMGGNFSPEKKAPAEGRSKLSHKDKKNPMSGSTELFKTFRNFQEMVDDLLETPSHQSAEMRDAAESVLVQLLNGYNNSPGPVGVEVLNSTVDYDTSKTLYFSYNDSQIMSFTEVPSKDTKGGKLCKITIRDSTGHYVWKAEPMYDDLASQNPPSLSEFLQEMKKDSPICDRVEHERPIPPGFKFGELPLFDKLGEEKGIDMLDQALQYLENETDSLKCFGWDAVLRGVANEKVILDCITGDLRKLNQQSQLEVPDKLPAKTKRSKEVLVPTEPNESITIMQTCRQFLSQIGFLSAESRKQFFVLENGEPMIQQLKSLDKLRAREVYSASIVYVGPGQEDSNQIVRNTQGSPLYEEFVKGMGWLVDLNSHNGFSGSLVKKNPLHGSQVPYFADSSREMIFHTNTMMPSELTHDQLEERIKILHSDAVHIVWSEHNRDYKPNSLSSDVVETQIIVYPLPDGLFRIQVERKERVRIFGSFLMQTRRLNLNLRSHSSDL
eukprot:TRINITY_DN6763_c1_g3_i2.p1 TRINITY_DN6763_c1_g3~~TRINITY_DN6763_c1_g3_i2.p1  ORF type:complete len:1437 (+),score=495.99 TRINITY_DN6763_c1_g3_i2:71-4312(+)